MDSTIDTTPELVPSAEPALCSSSSAATRRLPRLAGVPPRVLSIAGSDSGGTSRLCFLQDLRADINPMAGGAGIQADLKSFAAFEVYGMSAITVGWNLWLQRRYTANFAPICMKAVTAQNTLGVQGQRLSAP